MPFTGNSHPLPRVAAGFLNESLLLYYHHTYKSRGLQYVVNLT